MATIINQNWLEANRNEKCDDSAFQRLIDYDGTSNGAYRTLQAIQKTARLGNELVREAGHVPSSTFIGLDNNLGVATSALGIIRLPLATSTAIKSISALGDSKDSTELSRKVGNAIKDTADAVSTYGYTATFLTGNPALRSLAQTADMTSDVIDFNLTVSDYRKASALESVATGRVKEAITHSKNYYWWCIAKTIASIASTIFGVFLLVNGAPLLPAIALIALSLITTSLAITKDMYKIAGQHKVITFDRDVRVV